MTNFMNRYRIASTLLQSRSIIYETARLGLVGLILLGNAPTPVKASVNNKQGSCFQRSMDSSKILARYPNCLVYIGTYGLKRALWGMEVKGKFNIQAHSDSGSKVVYANGRRAVLFTSNGKSPDTLDKNEYFCIAFKGDSKAICAYGFLVPGSR